MNRIVRERYPVSKLPEDLREGFGPDDAVRVTIDRPVGDGIGGALDSTPEPNPFSRFRHLRRNNFASDAEVDAYVRALRDEWIDRER